MQQQIEEIFRETSVLAATLAADRALHAQLEAVARECVACFAAGGKILLAGNGGSAAQAQHIACEFVGRFGKKIRRALPAIALSTDSSVLTALANDAGFDGVFARQIEAHGVPGDVLIAYSTSGESPNILQALATAKAAGLRCIGMSGQGGSMQSRCDQVLRVPSADTARIQEAHMLFGHLLCQLIEEHMFGDTR